MAENSVTENLKLRLWRNFGRIEKLIHKTPKSKIIIPQFYQK